MLAFNTVQKTSRNLTYPTQDSVELRVLYPENDAAPHVVLVLHQTFNTLNEASVLLFSFG